MINQFDKDKRLGRVVSFYMVAYTGHGGRARNRLQGHGIVGAITRCDACLILWGTRRPGGASSSSHRSRSTEPARVRRSLHVSSTSGGHGVCGSMRSWESVRPAWARRHGVPGSHGPRGPKDDGEGVNPWLLLGRGRPGDVQDAPPRSCPGPDGAATHQIAPNQGGQWVCDRHEGSTTV